MEEQGTSVEEKVSLEHFAELAGFPLELVKKELFADSDPQDEICMSELRAFMLKYLDNTMID